MHIVSLSFDDGFRDSTARTSAIHERLGLKAGFNVVATGHLRQWWGPELGPPVAMGDFAMWNELVARGHEIMPHGYRHANKAKLPLVEAQRLITDCLAVFQAELRGYEPRRAVFNFPYNASTPAIDAWLPTVIGAYRAAGDALNPVPTAPIRRMTTSGYGPGRCDQALDQWLAKLLAQPSGWLVFCAHGLDDEGWGPMGSEYLERTLARLQAIPSVRILPVGQALSACHAWHDTLA